MEYLKRMILLFLIAGLSSSVIGQPTPPPENPNDQDYAGDDDYQYEDEISSEKPQHIENNETTGDPPYFEKAEIIQTASVGDDVTLRCDGKNLKDTNIFLWFNGTQQISQHRTVIRDRSRITVLSDFALNINNVQESDSTEYTVEVLPQKIECKVKLIVQGTPQVVIYSADRNVSGRSITFNEGDRVEFECKALNIKNPTFKWSLRGQRISESDNVTSLVNGKIVIENVDHHHHGLYQCIGDSGEEHPPHGSVTLNIAFKPKVTVTRHYCNTELDETAELYCVYHANPDHVRVHWNRNGVPLKTISDKYIISTNDNYDLYKNNHTVLFVKRVDTSDLGEYQCIIENKLGEGSGRIHLITQPEPAHYQDMKISGRKVSLHWLVRSRQPLVEAILDYQINGSQTWMSESPRSQKHNEHTGIWKIRHELELTPGTWHVRVKTKNSAGWSKFSKDHTFEIIDTPANSNSILEDSVYAAGVGGNSGSNSASRQIYMSASFVISLLLLASSLVPSLRR